MSALLRLHTTQARGEIALAQAEAARIEQRSRDAFYHAAYAEKYELILLDRSAVAQAVCGRAIVYPFVWNVCRSANLPTLASGASCTCRISAVCQSPCQCRPGNS